MQYNMRKARNQLSKLVQAVLAGGDVVIARNGIPAARLVKINTPDAMRSYSKDPDLQKAPQALMRASEKARQLAEQTGTAFVVRKSPLPSAKTDKQK